jgi:hypothetical protein
MYVRVTSGATLVRVGALLLDAFMAEGWLAGWRIVRS